MIELTQLRSVIESLLFCADAPLSVEKICELTEQEVQTIEDILSQMEKDYLQENRGFVLKQTGGGWRLFTNPHNDTYVQKFVLTGDMRKLTNAALETLAIVAYKQPVTRAEVNYIRGVNSEGSLNTLIQRGLVKESGRRKIPGNPIIYSTTKKFLESASLNSIKDLPNLKDFAPDVETKEKIEQSLSEVPGVEEIPVIAFDEE
jgi:segregation and condensation protein B